MPPKAPNAKKSRGGDPPGARRRVENDDDDDNNSNSAATAKVKEAHPATLHIPSIGRILRFAAPTFQRAQELSTVCDTWNEVVRHFSKTFWENKLDCLTCEELCHALGIAAENGWLEVVLQMIPRILAYQREADAMQRQQQEQQRQQQQQCQQQQQRRPPIAVVMEPCRLPLLDDKRIAQTPAYRAAAKGHVEVVRALISAGGGDHDPRYWPLPPVFAAIDRNSVEMARVIAQVGNSSPAHKAVMQRGLTARRRFKCPDTTAASEHSRLLWSSAESREYLSMSPLQLACFVRSSEELVKCLLDDFGADPNFTVADEHTALMLAAFKSNVAAVALLLSRGARVDTVCCSFGRTALHYAAIGGSKRCVELLLDAGAKVGALDREKNTALSLARANKSSTAVASLLESRVR